MDDSFEHFFSHIDIFDIENYHSVSDNLLIADKNAFLKCIGYFNLPDYQRSIRSTIKNGSVCGMVDAGCWSKLQNRKGIPEKKNDNGLIEIGCVIQAKLKKSSRSAGKLLFHKNI